MDKMQASAELLALKDGEKTRPKERFITARRVLLALALIPWTGVVGAMCCASRQSTETVLKTPPDAGADGPKEVSTDWYFSPKDLEARNQLVGEYVMNNLKQLMKVDQMILDSPYHTPFTLQGVDFIFSYIFHVENEVLEIQMGISGPPAADRLFLRNIVNIPLKRSDIKKILF
jgi:hypothetical protein